MDLYNMLMPVRDALHVLFEKVDDTMLALGSDLYSGSIEAYGYVKSAGKSQGLDSLREQLKVARQKTPEKKTKTPTA